MALQTFDNDAYRYGFNGMEKDDDWNGSGNAYDFGARIYDARLGRWLAVDRQAIAEQSPYNYVSGKPITHYDPDGNYQRDGHYWTVYYVALLVGLDATEASKLAYSAEYYDTRMRNSSSGDVSNGTMTWSQAKYQKSTHALTGGNAVEERKATSQALVNVLQQEQHNIPELRRLMHRIGDTYAHTKLDGSGNLYGYTSYDGVNDGHTRDWNAPDMIGNRPELYGEYVRNLAQILIDGYGLDKNVDDLDFSPLLALVETAKPTNNEGVKSLIGAINYEVMVLKGENSFFIADVKGMALVVADGSSHDLFVKNTKEYLDSKGVLYEVVEVYKKRARINPITGKISKVRTGTTFNIIESSYEPGDSEAADAYNEQQIIEKSSIQTDNATGY